MTALLRKKDLSGMIATHHPARDYFENPSSGPPIPYDTVDSDMEPSRKFFWGRNEKNGTYFISDSTPKTVVIPILQMEHHRRSENIGHLEAVTHALGQLPNTSRRLFGSTVLAFYTEEATSLEEPAGDQEDHDKDIIATRDYLARLFN